MDFGEVLSRAWQIIWKYKVLWLFGILASCSGGGGGGGGNSGFQFSQGDTGQGAERFFERTLSGIPDWQIGLIIAAFVLLVLLIVVIAIVLGTVGRIGLIKGTLQAEEDAERLSFGELFRGSLPYFWRVFGLNLLVGLTLIVVVLVLVAFFAGVALTTLGIGLICLLPLICLLIPAFWLVQVVVEQAIIAIVVEDKGITDGLRRGWQVFRDNLGNMVVMALILYLGIGLVGGLIIALPLLIIVAPAVAAVVGSELLDSSAVLGGGLLLAGLCFVAYLPVLILLQGGLRAYIGSAWTLTFLRLRGEAPAAELEIPPAS